MFINPPIFPAAFLNQLQFNIPLIPGLPWAGLICQDLNVNNVAPAVGWLIRTLVIATFDKTNTRVKYSENRNKTDYYLRLIFVQKQAGAELCQAQLKLRLDFN